MSGQEDVAAEVARLTAVLEQNSGPQPKIEAAQKLGRLGVKSRAALDALARQAKEYNQEVTAACVEAIDRIMTRGCFAPSYRRVRQASQVTIEEEKEEDGLTSGLDLTQRVFCTCHFCGKESDVRGSAHRHAVKLSGPDKYYCTFCLRHGYNGRNGRNVLVLTYRAVVGYYYYSMYALSKGVFMYLTQLRELVEEHRAVGETNPLFCYDPETMCWFVDFSLVGDTRRKMPVSSVLDTLQEILLVFNLKECVADISPAKLFEKYREAVVKFHQGRSRPPGQKILAPTLYKTGASEFAMEPAERSNWGYTHYQNDTAAGKEKRKIPWEETRAFTPQVLSDALGRKA